MSGSFLKISLTTLLILGLGAACDKASTATGTAQQPTTAPQPQSLPRVAMKIGNTDFTIEVADSDEEHQMGMMHRHSNPADHGMIFIFPEEQERNFWMKNTHIPLDIIYLDRTGKVVSIRPARPLDQTNVPSGGPAKYVIELNLGRAAAIGLKRGDTVSIPEGIREPAK